jgi:hypothetical protein
MAEGVSEAQDGESRTAVVLRFPDLRKLRATDEELAEYREMLPALRLMLKEWALVKTACPMARRLTEE